MPGNTRMITWRHTAIALQIMIGSNDVVYASPPVEDGAGVGASIFARAHPDSWPDRGYRCLRKI